MVWLRTHFSCWEVFRTDEDGSVLGLFLRSEMGPHLEHPWVRLRGFRCNRKWIGPQGVPVSNLGGLSRRGSRLDLFFYIIYRYFIFWGFRDFFRCFGSHRKVKSGFFDILHTIWTLLSIFKEKKIFRPSIGHRPYFRIHRSVGHRPYFSNVYFQALPQGSLQYTSLK